MKHNTLTKYAAICLTAAAVMIYAPTAYASDDTTPVNAGTEIAITNPDVHTTVQEPKYDNIETGTAMKGTWKQSGSRWWYQYEDKSYASDGLYEINGTIYAFDKSSWMVTGWYKMNDSWTDPDTHETYNWTFWFYFNPNGSMYKGWLLDGGKWYYLDLESGFMYSDCTAFIRNTLYGFDKSGAMVTGWYKDVIDWGYGDEEVHHDTLWYYFKPNGAAYEGWLYSGDKWYYLHPQHDGVMCANEFQIINGKTYYFNGSGAMVTGWKKIDGDWYYFDENGAQVVNKWVGNYYLTDDGSMATSEWVDGGRYYVDGSGKWVPGKKK